MKLFLLRYLFFYFVIIFIFILLLFFFNFLIINMNLEQSFPLVLYQPTFTCSKLKIETLEQGIKYI